MTQQIKRFGVFALMLRAEIRQADREMAIELSESIRTTSILLRRCCQLRFISQKSSVFFKSNWGFALILEEPTETN